MDEHRVYRVSDEEKRIYSPCNATRPNHIENVVDICEQLLREIKVDT